MEKYRFSDAAKKLYEFMWHRFADQYIEEHKLRFSDGNIEALCTYRHAFLIMITLLHPFMPFVTEALWQRIQKPEQKPLIISSWPGTKTSN
jgi:valyl-tRNA synthetase